MPTIRAKAGDIKEMVTAYSLPYSSDVLFNPLRLIIKDGEIRTALQAQTKTAFVQAKATIGEVEGEGEVVIDTLELTKFLGLYAPSETVTISFTDGVVEMQGSKKKVTLYPQAETPTVPSVLPSVEDGVVQYRTGPATTKVVVDADDLSDLINDAKAVEVAEFPLEFYTEQNSQVSLGSHGAKHNQIQVALDCKVEGEDASTTIGEDFAFLFNNLTGEVELQLTDGHPLAVIAEWEWGRALYILTPRKAD